MPCVDLRETKCGVRDCCLQLQLDNFESSGDNVTCRNPEHIDEHCWRTGSRNGRYCQHLDDDVALFGNGSQNGLTNTALPKERRTEGVYKISKKDVY